MKRILIRAMLASAFALPLAHAAGAPSSLPPAGDVLYALPPEAAVRRALEALPEQRIGSINNQLAVAERARLVAGSHEWIARGSVARREVNGSERYREQEIGLERSVRWFGKAAKDQAIGDKGIAVAELRRADAWHEAGRALMRDWYAALSARAASERLVEQYALVQRLKDIAERRAKAGDGAALDVLQADTELRRHAALLEQAHLDAVQATTLLSTAYVGLPEPQVNALPEPRSVADPVAADLERMMEDNHELELAEAESEWEALRAERASSERMPDPTVGVRAARERAGQERIVGLTLSIPLSGSLRSAEATAASLRAGIARERAEQTRLRVQVDARRVLVEQAHRYRLWVELRDVANQSARQAELKERAYQAGETTLAEALLSRRQALEAALSAQTAQIDALAAAARVELDAHALWRFD